MNEIKFYRTGDDYGFLSNFYSSPIFLESKWWPTVEHYFQASKFTDDSIKSRIRNIDSPMKAASEGRNVNNKIRENWDHVKESYMLKALKAKFIQNPDLKLKLLQTGNAILIEDTANDRYWANGGDGSGENRLGSLLMELRNYLLDLSNDFELILPPWFTFPDVSRYDMFWRMGFGGQYLDLWYMYFESTDKEKYIQAFPPNEEWDGFYDE